MVQAAIAASVRGRRRDALRMMATAESTWKSSPMRGDQVDALVALATGWVRVGRTPRAMRLVEARLRALRHDGVARNWSPAVEIGAVRAGHAPRQATPTRGVACAPRRGPGTHTWPQGACWRAFPRSPGRAVGCCAQRRRCRAARDRDSAAI
jgi:hypothetical protein